MIISCDRRLADHLDCMSTNQARAKKLEWDLEREGNDPENDPEVNALEDPIARNGDRIHSVSFS